MLAKLQCVPDDDRTGRITVKRKPTLKLAESPLSCLEKSPHPMSTIAHQLWHNDRRIRVCSGSFTGLSRFQGGERWNREELCV
jgi:hypothetical protein